MNKPYNYFAKQFNMKQIEKAQQIQEVTGDYPRFLEATISESDWKEKYDPKITLLNIHWQNNEVNLNKTTTIFISVVPEETE